MIIVDLDGTLTEKHAVPCLDMTRDEIFRVMDPVRMCQLQPRIDVLEKIRSFRHIDNRVNVITARWDILRSVTESWLVRHLVYFWSLRMRKFGDERKSVDVKLEMYNDLIKDANHNQVVWFDDDISMLNALPNSIEKVLV